MIEKSTDGCGRGTTRSADPSRKYVGHFTAEDATPVCDGKRGGRFRSVTSGGKIIETWRARDDDTILRRQGRSLGRHYLVKFPTARRPPSPTSEGPQVYAEISFGKQ